MRVKPMFEFRLLSTHEIEGDFAGGRSGSDTSFCTRTERPAEAHDNSDTD